MKTYIKGKREVIEQAGISQYLFNFDFDIPQVGLECNAELTFEPKKFINNLYEYLLSACEDRLKVEPMFYQKPDGTQAPISYSMLASLVMNLTTQSMQKITDDGKSLMTVIIKEEKEILKEYREKTKGKVNELKEHVKNNEDLIKEYEKTISTQEKTVEKMAGISSEKTSKSRGDDEVVSTTTQENKPYLQRAVQGEPKERKPKKARLDGLL